MAAGRPPKYDKKFHPEDFIRLSKQGYNNIEICSIWDIDESTIYDWGKKHKEFSKALKRGKKHLEFWYFNLGKNIATGKMKGANVTAYIWLTKNAVGWSDKVENINRHEFEGIDFEDENED